MRFVLLADDHLGEHLDRKLYIKLEDESTSKISCHGNPVTCLVSSLYLYHVHVLKYAAGQAKCSTCTCVSEDLGNISPTVASEIYLFIYI